MVSVNFILSTSNMLIALMSLLALQARLNEIVTSGTKMIHEHGSSEEFPWMTDGAGLPPNAHELLRELVLRLLHLLFVHYLLCETDHRIFLVLFAQQLNT